MTEEGADMTREQAAEFLFFRSLLRWYICVTTEGGARWRKFKSES
jgi:hypothetical protein